MSDRVAALLAGESAPLPSRMGAIFGALPNTWPARLAKTAFGAAALPGDVYQGNVPVTGEDGRTNPDIIPRAVELAGLSMLGTTGAPAGAIGNGPAGFFKWSPLDNAEIYRELALKARNEGRGGTVRMFASDNALDASRRPLTPWEESVARARGELQATTDKAAGGFRTEAADNPLLRDPHYDLGYRPSSQGEAFKAARGDFDVLGLADGRTVADLLRQYGPPK